MNEKPIYHPVGELFDYKGTKLRAVEETENGCDVCYSQIESCKYFACMSSERPDNTDVHFEKA